jgi:hypothetical protein
MSIQPTRGALGSASVRSREAASSSSEHDGQVTVPAGPGASPELFRALAEVKGQAQFLLYLADQIEESLEQLASESDACHGAFLCKVLGMYSSQLESRHHGLGDKISETCQEVYVTVREYDGV